MTIDLAGWPDYDGWSEEQIELYEFALGGLFHGDLKPLAIYLRAGFPVGGGLAEAIADGIDLPPHSDYKIVIAGRVKGKPSADALMAKHQRKLDLGARMHVVLDGAARGHSDSIFIEQAQVLGAKEKELRLAVSYFRKQLRGPTVGGEFPALYDPIGAGLALGAAMRENAGKT